MGCRLHNMRTAYALRPDRQRAVAVETMQVWCSLAERLGMFALKVRGPLSNCAARPAEGRLVSPAPFVLACRIVVPACACEALHMHAWRAVWRPCL